MKVVYKIDSDGFFKESVLLHDGQGLPLDCVDVEIPTLFKAQFKDGKWIEGATLEEIEKRKSFQEDKIIDEEKTELAEKVKMLEEKLEKLEKLLNG